MATFFGQTDAPVTNANEEYLGLGHYVEALSDFILACQTPLTISIQGDWGTGKTSMMNLVRERLHTGLDEKKVATFWFNTWQFSQFSMQDDVAISLLSSLLDQLSDNANTKKLLAAIPRKAVGYMGQAGRAAFDVLTGGGGDAFKDSVDNLAEKMLGTETDLAKQITKIKIEFEKAVAERLAKENACRLVVFVDDLDRLAPEKAVELLEVIKLFLDVPNCVFLLAVDYHVVARGLEKKFGFGINDPKGKSFFDKIIQLPFNLPTSQYKTRDYLRQLFGHDAKIDSNDLDLYVRLATLSIGSNPRSLKRLFNALQLLEMVAKSRTIMTTDTIATAEERYRILFAVMCLQLAYPAVYEFIIKQRNTLDDDFLRSLFNTERLQESTIITVLQKSLGELNEEILERFRQFMQAFYEALQLQSDQTENGDETLVQAEIDVLLSFLSFSSLTVSSSEIQTTDEQGFRHKQAIIQFMNEELSQKYQALLETMNSKLTYWFSGENGGIYFEFRLGAMNFNFCVTWLGSWGISVYLDDPGITSAAKSYAVDWFNREFKEVFSTPIINKRKSYAYMILKQHQFAQETEVAKLEKFKNIMNEVLTSVLPKLTEFYEPRAVMLQQLRNFTERLEQRLEVVFPVTEGWTIDNNLKTLCVHTNLKIHKATWNKKLAIAIEQDWHHLTNLYFGIHKLSNKRNYSEDLENQTLSECQLLFMKGKSSAWWLYYQYAKDEYLTLLKGSQFISSGIHYAFTTQEQEDAALDYFVEKLSKFREIEVQLDALAASAKS